jgi:hypothetical protein
MHSVGGGGGGGGGGGDASRGTDVEGPLQPRPPQPPPPTSPHPLPPVQEHDAPSLDDPSRGQHQRQSPQMQAVSTKYIATAATDSLPRRGMAVGQHATCHEASVRNIELPAAPAGPDHDRA